MRIASSWGDPDTFVDIKMDRIKYPDPKFNIVVQCTFEKRVPCPVKETFYTLGACNVRIIWADCTHAT